MLGAPLIVALSVALLLPWCALGADRVPRYVGGRATLEQLPVFQADPNPDAMVEDASGRVFPVNQVIVMLKAGSPVAAAEKVARQLGGKLVGQIPEAAIYQLEVPAQTIDDLTTFFRKAEKLPTVVSATYNLGGELGAGCVADCDVNATLADNEERCAFQDIGFFQALTVFEQLQSSIVLHPVTVGVIDSGVDLTQGVELQELYSSGRLTSLMPNETLQDTAANLIGKEYHGTKVCSLIAARENDTGISGLASELIGNKLHLAVGSVFPPTGPQPVAKGITQMRALVMIANAARAGASVVNMSLGWDLDPNTPDDTKVLLGFERLISLYSEVLIVAAAGNKGRFVYPDTRVPAGLELDNVIGVAATAQCTPGEIASFSNFGSQDVIQLAAPGESVPVTDPLGTVVAISGTSFSTPVVTALAAVLFSLNPALTPSDVRSMMMGSGGAGWYMPWAAKGSDHWYPRLHFAYTLFQYFFDHATAQGLRDLVTDPHSGVSLWPAAFVMARLCGELSYNVSGEGVNRTEMSPWEDMFVSDEASGVGGVCTFDPFAGAHCSAVLPDGSAVSFATSGAVSVGGSAPLAGSTWHPDAENEYPVALGTGGSVTLEGCWIEDVGVGDPRVFGGGGTTGSGSHPIAGALVGTFEASVLYYEDEDDIFPQTLQLNGTFDLPFSRVETLQTVSDHLLDACTFGRAPVPETRAMRECSARE
jgi:subtilisin family serine protease